MKLKNEIPFIRESFSKITNLTEYAEKLKATGNHKDFATTLASDYNRATITIENFSD